MKRELSVISLLTTVFFLIVSVNAEAFDKAILSSLQANLKLNSAKEVLADFYAGEAETGVIVLLKPSVVADALKVKSQLSGQVPEEFKSPGAPTYYNLQEESVKKELAATVTETVEKLISGMNPIGLTVKQKFTYQFGFAARVTAASLLEIVNHPDVIDVSKDHILQAHLAQGIPLMNATTPRTAYSGSGVSIAICDTGIDTSHPRLGDGGFPNAKVIGGYDTGDDDADPRPNSVSGNAHGTACAGIAAGDTGTVGDYIGGVAYGAKLYAIKISTGNTGNATSGAMIAGWEWAVTHQNDVSGNPIRIISTSFGGGNYSSTCDAASIGMTTAAANAVAAGITIFVSSGNDGFCGSMGWPACISYVNSVGAVYDANIGNVGFCVDAGSCTGVENATYCTPPSKVAWEGTTSADKVTVYSNSASFLTLFAPSHNAYTADIVGSGGYSSGDWDTSFGGTSAACPYAAGAAAVLQSAAKAGTGSYLTPAQVRQYLVNYGNNVIDSKVAVTRPRINLGNAVDALPCGPGSDGISCDDGNSCTTGDICASEVCVGGPPLNCDDGNVCTDDTCSPATGCVNANNTSSCDDGNACTTTDTCSVGTCVGGVPLDCNDGNVCTDDICSPVTGCGYVNNTSPCDDGNACTTTDTCSVGTCAGGVPLDCNDGNVCTDDTCSPVTGCGYVNNTSPCDDGNACTTTDTCSVGTCVGGVPLDCNDGNVCTDDICSPATGCGYVNNTSPCDDGNACTTTDTCSVGTCVGGVPLDCNDGNSCTDDTCSPATGCGYVNNTSPCDDGNACTTTDTCSVGTCVGGVPLDCNDGNSCTDDTCSPATGCGYVNNTSPCDDGNACTTTDTCSVGTCVGGVPLDCNDNNVCTDDSCDTAIGCVNVEKTSCTFPWYLFLPSIKNNFQQ